MKNVTNIKPMALSNRFTLLANSDERTLANFVNKVLIYRQNERVMQSICYIYYAIYSKSLNGGTTKYFHDQYTSFGHFDICCKSVKLFLQNIIYSITDEEVRVILKICNYSSLKKDSIPVSLSILMNKLNYDDNSFLGQLTLMRDSLKIEHFLENIVSIGSDFLRFFFITFRIKENVMVTLKSIRYNYFDMIGMNFCNYNFEDTIFYRSNFMGATFTNCTFLNVDFDNSTLIKSNFISSVIQNVDFSLSNDLFNSKFLKTSIINTNFSQANLIMGKFIESSIINCLFYNTILSEAEMLNVILNGVNFKDARFDEHSKIQLAFPKFENSSDVMNYFSSDNNNFCIFSSIHSISSMYDNLQICLMLQVVDFLKRHTGILKKMHIYIRKAINDKKLLYRNSTDILLFIQKVILPIIINEAEVNGVQFFDLELPSLYNHLLQNDDCIKNYGYLNQFIYFCQLNLNLFNKFLLENIEEYLLKIPEIVDITKMITEIFIDNINQYRIFISNNKDKALVVHNDFLSKFLYNNHTINVHWNELLFFTRTNNGYKVSPLSNIILDSIFEEFILFKNAYSDYKKNSKFIKLIELLDLNELKEKFIEALYRTSSNYKLVSSEHSNKLQEVFIKYLSYTDLDDIEKLQNITLIQDHIDNIFREFLLNNASDQEKANLLLCLSGIFARYSSDSYFGVEADSPFYLRLYALALMNSAISFDENLINIKFLSNNADNWRYKFLGLNNAFSCTNALSKIIIDYCEKVCKEMLDAIMPPQWRIS